MTPFTTPGLWFVIKIFRIRSGEEVGIFQSRQTFNLYCQSWPWTPILLFLPSRCYDNHILPCLAWRFWLHKFSTGGRAWVTLVCKMRLNRALLSILLRATDSTYSYTQSREPKILRFSTTRVVGLYKLRIGTMVQATCERDWKQWTWGCRPSWHTVSCKMFEWVFK